MQGKLKKLGMVGILFFTIKGLLWLAVPGAIVAYRGCTGETQAEAAEVSPASTQAE